MYTVSDCPGGATYLWQTPPGWTMLNGQGTATLQVLPDTTDGTIGVQVCNQCGCGMATSLSVTADSCIGYCLAIGGSGQDFLYTGMIDGQYAVLIGECNSCGSGSTNIYVAKVDLTTGTVNWTYTMDYGSWDAAVGIEKIPAGYYVITGWIPIGIGGWSNYLVRINANTGNTIGNTYYLDPISWGTTIEYLGNNKIAVGDASGQLIIVDLSTINITAAFSYSRPWAVKKHTNGTLFTAGVNGHICQYDANLSPAWCKQYGSGTFYWLGEAPNGNIVAAGIESSDIKVIEIDLSGNVIWAKRLGATAASSEWLPSYSSGMGYVASNGDILVTATTNGGTQGGNNVYVARLDANGNLKWARIIGGNGDDQGITIGETSNQRIVILGRTTSFGNGSTDFLVIVLNPDGSTTCTSGCFSESASYITTWPVSPSNVALPSSTTVNTYNFSGTAGTHGTLQQACP